MSARKELLRLFWETTDYRDFVRELCDRKLSSKIQTRSKLAQKLKITSGFVTKVLSLKAHLSAEHVEELASVLEFNEHETLAFLDKLLCSRTSSEKLKKVIDRRLQAAFSSSFTETVSVDEQKSLTPPPSNPIFWKIAQALSSRRGASVEELVAKLKYSEQRIVFLLDKMASHFPLEKIDGDRLRIRPNTKFSARKPGSQSLLELGLGIRRAAAHSLESRYPIHLVDQGDHYVAGSYILPLKSDQIRQLSVKLAQLTSEMIALGNECTASDDTRYVGVCFDMFDY